MNHKKMLILSVILNSVLMIVLLLTALTRKEENKPPASPILAEKVVEEVQAQPLDKETSLLKWEGDKQEGEIIHKLPEVATVQEATQLAQAEPQPQEAVVAPPEPQDEFMEIVVKKGDTLDKIAKSYKTTISELKRVNSLSSIMLRIGQKLNVPKRVPVATEAYYTVKVGDNPTTIALKHHLGVKELLKINGLNQHTAKKLRPGDKLRVK